MASLDKFLFVGDSFTTGLQSSWESKYGKDVKFFAKQGRTSTELRRLLEKGANLPSANSINGVVLLIGINGILGGNKKLSNKIKEDTLQCIKLLKGKYKDKPLYVQRVFPVCSKYDKNYIGGWKNVNAAVKVLNTSNKNYCDTTDGIYYIDTTRGFSNNSVFVESKTLDGLHIAPKYYPEYIKNISDAVENGGSVGSGQDSSGYPPVIKKLLPDSISGQSYETSGLDPKFIVIHGMGGGTNQSTYDKWSSGDNGKNTSAHYCVQDIDVWQTCEDTWIAHHTGKPNKKLPGGKAGVSNSNSFGIEIADGGGVDKEKALDNAIELTRHLMKTYDISIKKIYQHYEVSGGEPKCPEWIIKNNKWKYFISEIEKRNKNNDAIKLNFNPQSTPSNVGELPNFDNREDLVNIEEVKGVVLVHMPPYHFLSKKEKEEQWELLKYDRTFHFEVDHKGFKTKVDNSLIAWGMQPNDKHTYIDRALFKNKPYKYVLNIGMFTPDKLEDYSVIEKTLIDRIGKVLWDNGLETKDLWREFDLNRAPSPFMYLEREQWKKFLREVDKQVKWRYENFGTPPIIKDREDNQPTGEVDASKNNVGKKGKTSRKCSLWKNPEEDIKNRIKILEKDEAVKIIDYDKKGMYKVETIDQGLKGWIWVMSVKVDDEQSEGDKDDKLLGKIKNPKAPDNGDDNDNKDEGSEDSDPPEDKKGEKNIPQPEIVPTMTQEEYLRWKSFTDPKLIDNFAGECEPYDKGLDEILDAPITEDDRLSALTEQLDTRNENTIYFNTVEGVPGGDGSHCVKNANELNMIIKPDPYNVDPIYPDLIIPPNYSTVDYNLKASKALPLTVLQEDNGTIQKLEDYDSNDLFFDYDLLKDKEKKSKGKPINYLDPYPYDDKIYELENHKPKVKIDEIESRLYDSNHPGDPVAHPIAKNFANVYDMAINQSKKIESRLVRIENTLATVLRNLGRIGSRINVNCVYYGGQDVFGKYKTIRCLRDDRIHDACSMTLDQCLSCTRYEPVIGQIYEILDDTGTNGSVVLDNMQMSYMNLEDVKNLNRVEERNSTKKFVNVNREEKEIPKQMTEQWEEEDKNKYIEQIKEKYTDEKELKKAIEEIKQEDYAFKMNWLETDLDLQEPDVKMYPTEGIKAKYKAQEKEEPIKEDDDTNKDNPIKEEAIKEENKDDKDNSKDDKDDKDEDDNSISADLGGLGDTEIGFDTTPDEDIIDDTDLDYQEDLDKLDKINKGEWVDTREEADTFEKNFYTSEDYFFEGFNSDNVSLGGSGFGAEARNKIVEMAKQIVQDHNDGKAFYSQVYRTNDYTKPVYGYDKRISSEKIPGYDCSSFVSCCYNHAGLKDLTYKNTITLYDYALSNRNSGAKVWDANMSSMSQALPGDIICTKGKGHTAVYIGNNQFAHSSTNTRGKGEQIRIDEAERMFKYSIKDGVFIRSKDLVKADEQAASGGANCPTNVKGPAVCAPSNALVRQIKGHEGFAKKPGRYNGESWNTGGYGLVQVAEKKWYNYMAPWPTTEKKATEALIGALRDSYCKVIWNGIKQNGAEGKFKQHQFDAFVSLGHNWSPYKVIKAEFFKRLCRNPNDSGAFDLWKRTACTVKATGKFSSALQKRRIAEVNMYQRGEYVYSKIPIVNGPGNYDGYVTENNGNGWLPGSLG